MPSLKTKHFRSKYVLPHMICLLQSQYKNHGTVVVEVTNWCCYAHNLVWELVNAKEQLLLQLFTMLILYLPTKVTDCFKLRTPFIAFNAELGFIDAVNEQCQQADTMLVISAHGL
jgi:hypothetical protein